MKNSRLLFEELQVAGKRGGAPWGVDHESCAVDVVDGAVAVAEIASSAACLASVVNAWEFAPGTYVGVWLENPLDILLAVAALTAAEVVPVLLSPQLDVDTVSRTLAAVADLGAIVTIESRREVLSRLAHRIELWESVSGGLTGEPIFRPPQSTRGPDSPYLVTHTSGTTGLPKLVIHTKNSFLQQVRVQDKMARVVRLSGYVAVAISPVHSRAVSGLVSVLRRGLPLVICGSESPDSLAWNLRRWRPTYLEAHPNTFIAWEDSSNFDDFQSVRVFSSTFDVMHPRTIDRLREASGSRMPLFAEIYGQSELGPISAKFHVRRNIGSDVISGVSDVGISGHKVGRSIAGYARVRVVGEDGRPVGHGVPGKIEARTLGQFAGYLNAPNLYAAGLRPNGWWDTGDHGVQSSFGRLTLVDRHVDLLDSAVSGIAVEDVVLARSPEFLEFVVLNMASAPGGQCSVAALRQGHTLDEVAWRARFGDVPDLGPLVIVDIHDFPRTATMKVQRSRLRNRIASEYFAK